MYIFMYVLQIFVSVDVSVNVCTVCMCCRPLELANMVKYQLVLIPSDSTPLVKVFMSNQLLDVLVGEREGTTPYIHHAILKLPTSITYHIHTYIQYIYTIINLN